MLKDRTVQLWFEKYLGSVILSLAVSVVGAYKA